jgi:hypothetical protein
MKIFQSLFKNCTLLYTTIISLQFSTKLLYILTRKTFSLKNVLVVNKVKNSHLQENTHLVDLLMHFQLTIHNCLYYLAQYSLGLLIEKYPLR